MKFEEKFPSLKDLILKEATKDIISIFCLDKQKVREVIDRRIKYWTLSINRRINYWTLRNITLNKEVCEFKKEELIELKKELGM